MSLLKSFKLIIILALLNLVVTSSVRTENISNEYDNSNSVASKDSRIVGGYEAKPLSRLFMTAIIQLGEEGIVNNGPICGGSLISSTWVLTAAHCFPNSNIDPDNIILGLGLHESLSENGEYIRAKRIIIHPGYGIDRHSFDIALIELSRPSKVGRPIMMDSTGYSFVGTNAYAMGWGVLYESGPQPEFLREVILPVVSNNTCSRDLTGVNSPTICAGYTNGGKDTCQGDSGGPLVIGNSVNAFLIGITSYGEGCARAGNYGVYTKVSYYLDWIGEYVDYPTEVNGQFGLWNGYLNMINIAELQNPTNSDVVGQINVLDSNGLIVSSSRVTVPANSQTDIILNDLLGFEPNQYGVVQISSNITGRIFYYKLTLESYADFDFAFGIPFSWANNGTSYASFNTYQPSSNFNDSGNLVPNWLSVVNLELSEKDFTVRKFNQSGALISSLTYKIKARSRIDIEAGHILPGKNAVGLIEVTPASSSTRYISQLVRYGNSSAEGRLDFAFPLVTKKPEKDGIVTLGSTEDSQNWLELINITNNTITTPVKFYSTDGSLIFDQIYTIAPKSQLHLNASNYYPKDHIGYAEFSSSHANSIIAQGMYYFKDSTNGSITAIAGLQSQSPSSSTINGSYNLFLSMESPLIIHNTSNISSTLDLELDRYGTTIGEFTGTMKPNSTVMLMLNDFEFYNTLEDSYGSIKLIPKQGSVVANSLRLRRGPDNLPQFVAPSALK